MNVIRNPSSLFSWLLASVLLPLLILGAFSAPGRRAGQDQRPRPGLHPSLGAQICPLSGLKGKSGPGRLLVHLLSCLSPGAAEAECDLQEIQGSGAGGDQSVEWGLGAGGGGGRG